MIYCTIKIIFTLSPVPLTATASRHHILLANTYSKSTLRAFVQNATESYDWIDYFPSYEIINNPMLNSTAFQKNLRNIEPHFVSIVMNYFLNLLNPRHSSDSSSY